MKIVLDTRQRPLSPLQPPLAERDGKLLGVAGSLRVLCAILCVLCVEASVFPAAAAPPDTVRLEELTWTEVRDAVKGGKTTIILPIGGTEQNGPYMALGKHNFRVRMLSEKIARQLGNALVAPVLEYVPEGAWNPPTGHMRFPGTISIPEAAFEQVLEGSARSFKLAGFRDIVLIGDHGGTQRGQKLVADRLDREWAATPVRVHSIAEYYEAGEGNFAAALEKQGYSAREGGKHAGLADTSLTLALAPQLVRLEALRAAAGKIADKDGIDGDPSRSSADLGHSAVDAIVSQTVAAIKRDTARR
jgi:creatinine amidohydrolase